MRNIIVTGGAGFIGSHLAKLLVSQGHKVSVIDDLSNGKVENIPQGATLYTMDICSPKLSKLDCWENVDYVFHLAAKARVQPSIKDPIPFNKVNVEGTLNILMAAKAAGAKRVIYSGSSSCYGNAKVYPTPENHEKNPSSPYGLQKYLGEQYCRLFSKLHGLDTVCLRYFNVYGPGMPTEGAYRLVIPIFKEQYDAGVPLTITNDGTQRRDFTHVDDVVSANELAMNHHDKFCGDAFNIGRGKNYSINEVAKMFTNNKVYGERRIEPFETLANNSKAKQVLGWTPQGDLPSFIESIK